MIEPPFIEIGYLYLPDSFQVADLVFKNVKDSEFTGYIDNVTVSIPD